MSQQRYTPEFKAEAVRQVTERGHSVQEVPARRGAIFYSDRIGEAPAASSLARISASPPAERSAHLRR